MTTLVRLLQTVFCITRWLCRFLITLLCTTMVQIVECLQWALCWVAGKLRCEGLVTMAESVYNPGDHFAARSIVAL